MTLNFKAIVKIDAQEKTRSLYESILVDNKYYPENPTKTKIEMNKKLEITLESEHLPHLRANVNSVLRLAQASFASIESAKI